MPRLFPALAGLLLAAALVVGCSRKDDLAAGRAPVAAAAPAALMAPSPAQARKSDAAAPEPGEARRLIAYRHFLTLELPRDAVAPALQASQARCVQMGPAVCQVESSSLVAPTNGAPPQGALQLRIAPDQYGAFREAAQQGADLIGDRTEAEDKTDTVIDVEARLRNKTALRDRLRQLVQAPGAKVADLVEIEQQLANVQAELDSLAGQRKFLALETDKVFVAIDFQARPELGSPGFFSPIARAFGNMGAVFSESVAALITFFAAVLPWAVVAVFPLWGLRRAWRRWRASRNPSGAH
ncbi:MAG: DUF4349 domain-containing protein [Azonexus sp.]|nr:DUF4349 domain-containing protein [Betaproteobacteria bacterium]MBK8919150.1 DUF4349 domain-containing protein [Betaproteobacteria bacterium]MBP6036528.1 DUF4349 domain-containing protein [Azonexus sp.]MBP6907136.1 DUF4349 domain-containing protein [Azonexus sp.]